MENTAGRQRRISIVRKAALPLFLASGAAGLIYEVTWTRSFGAVFGNTIFAVSTVLTAFMLGLALGSWLLGRTADKSSRPLLFYALLELMIGIYAFGFPAILAATDLFYRWFFRAFDPGFYPLSLVRFFLSVVILLVPTSLMGGTLPVLSKLWAEPLDKSSDKRPIGRNVGSLYALNTFGAVVGSFLAGYFLLELFGVR
ncbi:MAG: fused MFS/spermidine synthase, partial [Phycisphaerales bacterium]